MRRLLSPASVGLGLVALVLMAGMVWLGWWQLGVYDDSQRADAQALLRQPPVPLDSVLGPDEAFGPDAVGRPVTVRGRFLESQQVYVRDFDGANGRYAVVTPLRTVGGSAVLVVRGAANTLGAATAPRGEVTVRGILEPSQGGAGELDDRRVISRLSIASLVSSVGPDLYSGYILKQSSSPPQRPAMSPVAPALPQPSRWAGIRNLLYACQWWVFAVFVAFMWWRIAKDQDLRRGPVREGVEADAEPLTPLR